jgi:ATP-dependent DNA helicase RecG
MASVSTSYTWHTPLKYLKGVGPRRAEILEKEAQLSTCGDLLEYYPRKYLDYSRITPIAQALLDQEQVFRGRLGAFRVRISPKRNASLLTTTLYDGTAWMELVWYHQWHWIREQFSENQEVLVIGKPTYKGNTLQLSHPEILPLRSDTDIQKLLAVYPVYPLTEGLRKAGLTHKRFRMIFQELFQRLHLDLSDPIPPAIRQRYELMEIRDAYRAMHLPTTLEEAQRATTRFKFQEFFLLQVLLAQRKRLLKSEYTAPAFTHVGPLVEEFYHRHLPFQLTEAQKRVIREIRRDLGQPVPMNRLIQGDVGSGKTIVALFAALIAVGNGYQVALMAPTEVLAEQHARSFRRWLSPMGIPVGLLTGGISAAQRKDILRRLENNELPIVIGTHALYQENVTYARLGLTIIDEQHKFGVRQRALLWEKAHPHRPHNLLMTATPIPRTLALSLYGDVDVSIIDELPPNRQPVKTLVYAHHQRPQAWRLLQEELQKGRQAYIIYPLVEESEKLDLQAVEVGYQEIQKAFPQYKVGMIHGKMSSERKEHEMARFKSGQTQILVGTTVIEVGVDVPNATVLIVEHADRFGLSQLHQLRGRVGRGSHASYAVFIASRDVSEQAEERLRALQTYQDGFKISEIDLKLRGPGDFLGTKQSGLPEFRIADIVEDGEILKAAREAAFTLIEEDPLLQSHPPLQTHLHHYIKRYGLEFFTT